MASTGSVAWSIFLAALGLGMLIFVHELGHFVVAKLCGVKCEKFYLGFDIFGISIVKFRRGETQYGIGILPLGGYVKMLGQEDNPNRAAEERERVRLRQQSGEPAAAAQAAPAPADAAKPAGEGEQPFVLDPRSYLAKSVPQRMAIISAGVIMNLVLALVLAVIAYFLGVQEVACRVGDTAPGEPAWQADLRPGDRIVEINGQRRDRPLIYNDLREAVAVGNIDQGVRFKIQRAEQSPLEVTIKPTMAGENDRLWPTIGVRSSRSLTLADELPALKYTPAAETDKFKADDKIVAVGQTLLHDYQDLEAVLVRQADRKLRFTVERKTDSKRAESPTQRVEVDVRPRRMRHLGLKMKVGPIVAVQANSPAAAAGLKAGDEIERIVDRSPADWDGMLLDDLLRRKARAGESVQLSVRRTGEAEPLSIEIAPRDPPWAREIADGSGPTSAAALGIAYKVFNQVHAVVRDGPAAKATLMQGDKPAKRRQMTAGDKIVTAEFLPRNEQDKEDKQYAGLFKPIEVGGGKEQIGWPLLISTLQSMPPGTKLRLTLDDGRSAVIEPADSDDWFNPDRGFNFEADQVLIEADSLGEAISLGAKKTRDSTLIVFSHLRALITGQVSSKALGGIGTIATGAALTAQGGFTKYLLFLVAISGSLAVLNMLPIPILDGGHMVFLIWEGIFRKPPSEKALVALTWAGALVILGLLLYSNGLDVVRFFNWIFNR